MRTLVTCCSGFLGAVLRHHIHTHTQSRVIDVTRSQQADSSALRYDPLCTTALVDQITTLRPERIIHTAALSSAAACEADPKEAHRANFLYTAALAAAAERIGAHLTYVSTDLVFDGSKAPAGGFTEECAPSAASVYSRTKLAGEEAVTRLPKSAVVRISVLIGRSPSGAPGALGWMERALRGNTRLDLFYDEYRTPIWVNDAARALYEISERSLLGLWHLGGPERLSRVELGSLVATAMGAPTLCISPRSRSSATTAPPRPEDVSLNSHKLLKVLGWEMTPLTPALTSLLGPCLRNPSLG
jgi:dTDP-4-dehydrorhamnose reductase